MYDYPRIANNHHWTITDTPGQGNQGLTIRDENTTFYLTAVEYPDDVYEEICRQSKAYYLIEDRVILNYNHVAEDRRRYQSDIGYNTIIVKDNTFVGVLTCCCYLYEVHLSVVDSAHYQGILFTDGTCIGVNYDEFEGQPGNCKTRTDYSLEKR